MSTSACLAGADVLFVSPRRTAEGTRLANLSSEKSIFINMHGQQLPVKQAFVNQQMPKHSEKQQKGEHRWML